MKMVPSLWSDALMKAYRTVHPTVRATLGRGKLLAKLLPGVSCQTCRFRTAEGCTNLFMLATHTSDAHLQEKVLSGEFICADWETHEPPNS